MTAPGWYNAEGDPPGTTRYWDGTRWVGDPVYESPAASSAGYSPGGFGAGGYSDPNTPRRQLASAGSRLGGRIIDVLITAVVAILLFLPVITGVVSDINDLGPNPPDVVVERIITDAVEDNISRFGIVVVAALFWDFLWVALFGGTPGKLILGLRVANANSGVSPPGIGKAALRSLNRLIGLIPLLGSLIVSIIGLASLVMLFSDDQHRTVMDRIAGTVVVKK